MATVFSHKQESANGLHRPAMLGELLIGQGKLTEHDVTRVVATQRDSGLRFGETAERLGLITHQDLRQALANQFDYPYVIAEGSNLDPSILSAHDPFSRYAEAVRGLRTQLLLHWFTERRKTLVLVSPREDEGSVEVAANLAVACAQAGERTLLIDSNLRSGRLSRLLGVEAALGLSGILAGRSAFKDEVRSIDVIGNLFLLPAGVAPPNPQELLSKVMFAYLMETAPAAYDVVIVDASAADVYADSQMVAARAGGCLIVSRRHQSRLEDMRVARQRLELSGATVLGAVLAD